MNITESKLYVKENENGLSIIIDLYDEKTGKSSHLESVDYTDINDILTAFTENNIGWRIFYNWND
jgi:hypothetical protein